ncbi:large subunit ribosomal protein L24 [Metamycoplasma subdolum]|uniref:Large ribosomal subunit protein uL24 n=1 Tax=Metamycoplasma subdolum TaxID=92407 RepID=A0A3M0A7Y4_9BACT|nr:50S ribosomal protein L24 [Metamycoplasma subdolum]RMA78585.1 large subunit ribosomal protein L24 [Metamycoplasma subdolum]WPB50278.1 50S ribosomal protein L24 [Metamycoplasma subdolum]
MAKSKIKKNDIVLIISGKSKGKFAAVLATDSKNQTVTLKDINKKTKHHKPSQENQEGKIEKKEYPVHVSNVQFLLKKGAQNQKSVGTKIGWKIDNKTGKKIRVMRKVNKPVAE